MSEYFSFDGDDFSIPLKYRIIGFGIVLGVGVVLDFLAWSALFAILSGQPFAFAILFTCGNICTLLAP